MRNDSGRHSSSRAVRERKTKKSERGSEHERKSETFTRFCQTAHSGVSFSLHFDSGNYRRCLDRVPVLNASNQTTSAREPKQADFLPEIGIWVERKKINSIPGPTHPPAAEWLRSLCRDYFCFSKNILKISSTSSRILRLYPMNVSCLRQG